MIWQVLYNGLVTGALYGLVALGYSLIYGVAKLINFAHGDVMMVSAFVALTVTEACGGSLAAGVLAAMATGPVVALIIERVAVRPSMRSGEPLAPVMGTIGASIVLQAVVSLVFGVGSRTISTTLATPISLGSVRTTAAQLVSIGSALALTLVLMVFLRRHAIGRSLRAVADDSVLAEIVGINPRRVVIIAFALSGLLAGFAGIAVTVDAAARPAMGYAIGFRGFTAAVIGGIGNPSGAILGSLLIGMLSSVAGTYFASEWVTAYVFGALVITLLFKPEGLLPARRTAVT